MMTRIFGPAVAAALICLLAGPSLPARAGDEPAFTVKPRLIDDRKAVFATVESSDTIAARSRIGGTITTLNIDEGSKVAKGDVIAIVKDDKLTLKLKALDASLKALVAQLQQAAIDLRRQKELISRGTSTQSRLDNAQTAYDVAENRLKSAQAERSVTAEQLEEGKVFAPTSGRVLSVAVTTGAVTLPGESLAQVAAESYILRLELPERHARFINKGDQVLVGARGLAPTSEVIGTGTIAQVYPKLQQGRVIADVAAEGLGDYFVGERIRVWVSAGKRATFAIPVSFTFKRYGLDYVRLQRENAKPLEIVVQLGLPIAGNDSPRLVEVLAGLKAGDRLVKP